MDICVDSNILVNSLNVSSPFHPATLTALSKLRKNNNYLIVFPQNLIEFWAVATRPLTSNGLGFEPARAAADIIQIRSLFQLIDETPAIYPEWQRLVTAHNVAGKNVHDARIAAQMNVTGVDTILTFNEKDFSRYQNITALDPQNVS